MKYRKAFTLIELLIVISLLGILTLIGVTTFRSSTIKGRDSRRKQDVKNVALSLEAYYNDTARYPSSDASGRIVACGPTDTTACNWGSQWRNSKGTVYMVQLPKELSGNLRYYYVRSGNSFKLYTYLENPQDSSIITTTVNCGTGSTVNCNYGVSSPDTTP